MSEENNVVETRYSLRLARVESKISESGSTLTVRVMRSKGELFRIRTEVNEVFNIGIILNSLELATGSRNLRGVQWSKNDLIFRQFIDVQTFKNYYNSNPRNLKIFLFEPVKKLKENDERQRAMFEAHIHGNEHYGLKKTTAILRGLYYWRNATKDITRFIRECKHCSKKLNLFEENTDGSDEQLDD